MVLVFFLIWDSYSAPFAPNICHAAQHPFEATIGPSSSIPYVHPCEVACCGCNNEDVQPLHNCGSIPWQWKDICQFSSAYGRFWMRGHGNLTGSTDELTQETNGNQTKRIITQHHNLIKNRELSYAMCTINFTTETALYIPPTTFYIALYPERDHTKPHQVWHDTLAPT